MTGGFWMETNYESRSVNPRAKNLESTYKRWDWNLSFGTSGRPWTQNDPKSYRALPFGAFGRPWNRNDSNATKTLHLEHLGSVWPATDQDITKAGHVERLGGLEPEMIQDDTKTDHLDVQKAPCTFTRQKTMDVQKAPCTTCRRHLARSEIKKLIYWVHTLTFPSNLDKIRPQYT